MAGETIVTVVGNLTADPELRLIKGKEVKRIEQNITTSPGHHLRFMRSTPTSILTPPMAEVATQLRHR